MNPPEPIQEFTETLTVICKACDCTWQEEVKHFGAIAGYAREYDKCSRCWDEEKQDWRPDVREEGKAESQAKTAATLNKLFSKW